MRTSDSARLDPAELADTVAWSIMLRLGASRVSLVMLKKTSSTTQELGGL